MSTSDILPTPAAPAGVLGGPAAALLTALGCVLLAAPVGLLWAVLTPRVELAVLAAGQAELADPTTKSFIAADGWFLGLVIVAGVVTGWAAWRLGRRHGPWCVLGLVLGGLLAAEVARRTGQLVGADEAREAVQAGRTGLVELAVRLRSRQAQVGWPVAALATLMVLTVLDKDRPPPRRTAG